MTAAGAVPDEMENLSRLTPYFLAVALSPFFWTVFNVRVEILILTNLLPSSHHNLRVCRLTFWTRWVWAFDLETFMHLLFWRVPERSHFLSRITSSVLLDCGYKRWKIVRNWVQKRKIGRKIVVIGNLECGQYDWHEANKDNHSTRVHSRFYSKLIISLLSIMNCCHGRTPIKRSISM